MIRQLRSRLLVLGLVVAVAATAIPALAGEAAPPEGTGDSAQTARFVVYYFHGNLRCATCRKLEAYSEEAITEGFSAELEAGTLAWRAVNTDEPANEHYIQDFQLTNKSVVVVEYRDGEVARYENLNQIWRKVGDRDDFLEYVRRGTREFIGPS